MSTGLLPSVWVIDLYSNSIDSVRNIADFTDQCDDCLQLVPQSMYQNPAVVQKCKLMVVQFLQQLTAVHFLLLAVLVSIDKQDSQQLSVDKVFTVSTVIPEQVQTELTALKIVGYRFIGNYLCMCAKSCAAKTNLSDYVCLIQSFHTQSSEYSWIVGSSEYSQIMGSCDLGACIQRYGINLFSIFGLVCSR